MTRLVLGAAWLAMLGMLGLSACAEGTTREELGGVPPGALPSEEPDEGTLGGAQPAPGTATGSDGEASNPNLPIANEMPAGSNPPLAGAGLSVNGVCYAVCASSATDADALGVTDGWGWENEASCLVTGSAPAAQGTPCSFAPAELPPPTMYVPEGNVTRPAGVESAGFFVSGGRLYDRRGNDFVMRGVNNPLAWFRNRNTGALAWLTQIASTGANAVRLVWEANVGDIELLREAVERCLALRMVPMIEMHDVTGENSAEALLGMARYLTETDAVKQILLDHEDSLLINIANEWSGSNNIYVQAYTDAINIFRSAGIRHTLVIDSNGFGQNANTVINQGNNLLNADPQHNLLFSAHMYEQFRNAQTIRDTLQRAVDAQVPFIVGEFGFQHGSDQQGNPYQIPFEVLLSESVRLGIGYLGWSWTGNSGGVEYLDLTARSGSAGELSPWGDALINGPNGIRATAEPASIFFETPVP